MEPRGGIIWLMSLSPDEMRAEIAALEAALSRDPRFKKLTLLRELLPLYEVKAPAPMLPMPPMVAPETPYPWIATALSEKTKEDTIIAAARELIPREGGVHRSVLLRYLVDTGIMGTEKNPMGYLAKFMAEHRDIFLSDGKGNVSIQQPESEAPGKDQPPGATKPNGTLPEGTMGATTPEELWERQHGRRFPGD